jgi:hypothetical protein
MKGNSQPDLWANVSHRNVDSVVEHRRALAPYGIDRKTSGNLWSDPALS